MLWRRGWTTVLTKSPDCAYQVQKRLFHIGNACQGRPIDYAANPFRIRAPEDKPKKDKEDVLVKLRRSGILRNGILSETDIQTLEKEMNDVKELETKYSKLTDLVGELQKNSSNHDKITSDDSIFSIDRNGIDEKYQENRRNNNSHAFENDDDDYEIVTSMPKQGKNSKVVKESIKNTSSNSSSNDFALDPEMVQELRSILLPAKFVSMLQIGFVLRKDLLVIDEIWNNIVKNEVDSYVRQISEQQQEKDDNYNNIPAPSFIKGVQSEIKLRDKLMEEMRKYWFYSPSLIFSGDKPHDILISHTLPIRPIWEGKIPVYELDPIKVPKAYQLLFHPVAAVDLVNPDRMMNYIAGLFDANAHVYYDESNSTAAIELVFDKEYTRLMFYLKRFLRFATVSKLGNNNIVLRFTHKKGILRLLRILNGRIFSPALQSSFVEICKMWGYPGLFNPPYHNININSMWLSGYFESNGRFGASEKYSKVYASIKSTNLDILRRIRENLKIGRIRHDPQDVDYFSSDWAKMHQELFSTSDEDNSNIRCATYSLDIYKNDDLVKLKTYLYKYPMKGPQKKLMNIFHRAWLFLDRGYLFKDGIQEDWKIGSTLNTIKLVNSHLPPVKRTFVPKTAMLSTLYNPENYRKSVTNETKIELEAVSLLPEELKMGCEITKEDIKKYIKDEEKAKLVNTMEHGWIHQPDEDILNTVYQYFQRETLHKLTAKEIKDFGETQGFGTARFAVKASEEARKSLHMEYEVNSDKIVKSELVKTTLPELSTRQKRYLQRKGMLLPSLLAKAEIENAPQRHQIEEALVNKLSHVKMGKISLTPEDSPSKYSNLNESEGFDPNDRRDRRASSIDKFGEPMGNFATRDNWGDGWEFYK